MNARIFIFTHQHVYPSPNDHLQEKDVTKQVNLLIFLYNTLPFFLVEEVASHIIFIGYFSKFYKDQWGTGPCYYKSNKEIRKTKLRVANSSEYTKILVTTATKSNTVKTKEPFKHATSNTRPIYSLSGK